VVEFPRPGAGDRSWVLAGTLVPPTRLRDLARRVRARVESPRGCVGAAAATVRSVAAPVDPHRVRGCEASAGGSPREVADRRGRVAGAGGPDQFATLAGHLEVAHELQIERERRLAVEDELVRGAALQGPSAKSRAGVIHDVQQRSLTTVVGLTDWLADLAPGGCAGAVVKLESVRNRRRGTGAAVVAPLPRVRTLGLDHRGPLNSWICRRSSLTSPSSPGPALDGKAECAGTLVEITVRDRAPSPPVVASASEIRELLMNLVLNAFDAMPSGGQLRLPHLDERGAGAGVRCADNGIGMSGRSPSEGIRTRTFTTKGSRGTGLGLAVGRLIARA